MDRLIAFVQLYAEEWGIPLDKLLHLLGGASVALLAMLLGLSPGVAWLLSLAAGLAKEFYDMGKAAHSVEDADVWATWAGGSVASLLGALLL